jgi:hypothetical protein
MFDLARVIRELIAVPGCPFCNCSLAYGVLKSFWIPFDSRNTQISREEVSPPCLLSAVGDLK